MYGPGLSLFDNLFDYVTFGRGRNATEASSVIAKISDPTKIRSVTSNGPSMWVLFETHFLSASDTGFHFEIVQEPNVTGNTAKCTYDLISFKEMKEYNRWFIHFNQKDIIVYNSNYEHTFD